MDVTGPRFDRLIDNMIDQLDHRRFGGHIADVLGAFRIVIEIGLLVGNIAHHAVHGGTAQTVIIFHRFLNVLRCAQGQFQLLARADFQVLERGPVKWIEDRQGQGSVVHLQRENGFFLQVTFGKVQVGHGQQVAWVIILFDERKAEFVAQSFQKVLHMQVPVVDQNFAQKPSILEIILANLLHGLLGDLVACQQDFFDRINFFQDRQWTPSFISRRRCVRVEWVSMEV